uniref:Uncharacterized protein n=1 Tax=Mustela putorius furo TaxID=9669 RepID=M3Y6R0_MUSPF
GRRGGPREGGCPTSSRPQSPRSFPAPPAPPRHPPPPAPPSTPPPATRGRSGPGLPLAPPAALGAPPRRWKGAGPGRGPGRGPGPAASGRAPPPGEGLPAGAQGAGGSSGTKPSPAGGGPTACGQKGPGKGSSGKQGSFQGAVPAGSEGRKVRQGDGRPPPFHVLGDRRPAPPPERSGGAPRPCRRGLAVQPPPPPQTPGKLRKAKQGRPPSASEAPCPFSPPAVPRGPSLPAPTHPRSPQGAAAPSALAGGPGSSPERDPHWGH